MEEEGISEIERAVAKGELHVGDVRLEIAWHGALPLKTDSQTTRALVFLHEGLGCIAMWRDFPKRLSDRLGIGALVYSRAGYGGSDACTLPRPLDYMQREGSDSLPAILETLGIDQAILVGHSDGASIALVCAGSKPPKSRIVALVLEAPHVFCEDVSIESIERGRIAFERGDLRKALMKYHHANVDCAFRGWNDAWLDPGFRSWTIESFVREVDAPTLVIQGDRDEYGTLRQVDAIERDVRGPFERLIVDGAGHSPHRDAPDLVIASIEAFLNRFIPS